MQAMRANGLSETEHVRVGGLLTRALGCLKDVLQTCRGRYPNAGEINQELSKSVSSVETVRIHMDNAAHDEHPNTRLSYLDGDSKLNADLLAHAVAGTGENLDSD